MSTSWTARIESADRLPCSRGVREPAVPVIVGAAIVEDGRVLACERAAPADVAGMWEFPGGKVDPGESEVAALIRECDEELAVDIEVFDRVGGDVPLADRDFVLKVYRAGLRGARRPRALEHSALRWLAAGELLSVPWLPADAPIVAALAPLLGGDGAGADGAPRHDPA